ncbi:MAG: DM13 domain-containing protein [Bacteroidota bacterium]
MRFALLALALIFAACAESPTETVDDAAPGADATPSIEAPEADDPEAPADTMGMADMPMEERMAAMEADPDTMSTVPVLDAALTSGPEIIARGSFSGASGHDVTGEALLYRLDDGSHLVRLEGFETDNGPALEIWLVRRTSGNVGRGGASLGALKSTNGNQNYPVPAGIDPADFAGVSVWCERFAVNFGTAPLQ